MNIIENGLNKVRQSIGWVLQNPMTAASVVMLLALSILRDNYCFCAGVANAFGSKGSLLQKTISQKCDRSSWAYPYCKSFKKYLEATPEDQHLMKNWCEDVLGKEVFDELKEQACKTTQANEPLHHCGPIIPKYPY